MGAEAMDGIGPDGRASADYLLAFQRLAWSTLVFSVTRRCPLQCAHCITASHPGASGGVLSPDRAAVWADELPHLAEAGLERVTFTGGEPILAIDAVEILANAAHAAGLDTAVVTSGVWASSDAVARRIVHRLAVVDNWDIGYDPFHAADMSWERFHLAVQVLKDAGAGFSVRISRSRDAAATDALLQRVRALVGPEAVVFTQPVKLLGRAAGMAAPDLQPGLPSGPCLSTGVVIRDDGSTGPCCSGLSYETGERQPFDCGHVDSDGLSGVWRRWREDQLLRLLRLVGLPGLAGWLAELGVTGPETAWPRDVCEACVATWCHSPGVADALRERLAQPGMRAQLDDLERHLYGELWSPKAPSRRAVSRPERDALGPV